MLVKTDPHYTHLTGTAPQLFPSGPAMVGVVYNSETLRFETTVYSSVPTYAWQHSYIMLAVSASMFP